MGLTQRSRADGMYTVRVCMWASFSLSTLSTRGCARRRRWRSVYPAQPVRACVDGVYALPRDYSSTAQYVRSIIIAWNRGPAPHPTASRISLSLSRSRSRSLSRSLSLSRSESDSATRSLPLSLFPPLSLPPLMSPFLSLPTQSAVQPVAHTHTHTGPAPYARAQDSAQGVEGSINCVTRPANNARPSTAMTAGGSVDRGL